MVHMRRLLTYRRSSAERAQMRDDLSCLMYLLHRAMKLTKHGCFLDVPEFNRVDHVADEETDVVQRIVEFMCDASRQLTKRRQLRGLDELLLFLTEFLLATLHLRGRIPQIPHHVDHRLA